MTSKEKEILSEYYDKAIKKSLDEYLNYRIIEQEIKKELFKNKDLKNIVITRISIDDRDMDNPYCIVDFANVKKHNSITYSFPMKTKVLLFLNEKDKLVSEYVDAKLTMQQVTDRLSKDKEFGKIIKETTSKERCEALMEYIVEENQGYFDKERIGNDLTAILEDLKELECQKRKNANLLETINCIRNHAMIKKTKGLGTEIIVSFHSSDDDFEKIGWFFGIVK